MKTNSVTNCVSRRGRAVIGAALAGATIFLALIAANTNAASHSPGGDRTDSRGENEQPQSAGGAVGSDGEVGAVELPEQSISASPLPARRPLPGAREMQAIAATYPERVERVELKDGDWAALIDGQWYYWSRGRLLREELRGRHEQFTPIRFYNYYLGPLRIPQVDPQLEARLENILDDRQANPPVRHPGFQDALYGLSSYDEANDKMRNIDFLGFKTRMHPLATQALEKVEADIRERSAHDKEVAEFVRGLSTVAGFNWRNISGTRARSLHSYGIAIDLIPRYYDGDYGYWKWAAEADVDEWWKLGEEERFTVPQPIIDAFERHGFVWGGKWLFFDPIHFEYRPEVFELSNSPPND
ncbi:MAG: M15 family metallopeptidase [Spirochaetota bacterium]